MHVLIVPSCNFDLEHGRGIFEFHQAVALKQLGCTVNILSVGYQFLKPSNIKFGTEKFNKKTREVGVYTAFSRTYIPIRYIKRYFTITNFRFFEHLFVSYIEKHGRPDIIHLHNSSYAGSFILSMSEKYGIPYIVTEHDSSHARMLYSGRVRKKIIKVLGAASKIIAVSKAQKKFLGFLPSKTFKIIDVIPNMIDPEIVRPSDLSSVVPKHNPTMFVSVGSLDDNKNFDLLINGFAKYVKLHRCAKLFIVGSGHKELKLKRLSKTLGVNKQILFMGYLNRKELYHLIKKSDIYVQTSVIETFGVAILEALALGKVVVSTNSGGPSDLVNKNNGIILSDISPSALCDAMIKMTRHFNEFDPDYISTKAYDNFSSSTIAEKLLITYEQVLDLRK